MIGDHPLAPLSSARSVFVAHGQGPYANTRKALHHADLGAAAGKRVLLKPNAGRVAQPQSGITTHPQVVAAAIDAFQEAGAKVAVGESPIAGVQVMEAFDATGITEVARQRGCPLLNMDTRPCAELQIPEGRAIRVLQVCPEVLEHDWVVSVPVMKMHMHTGVTLSVKNMKGCLWRRSKVQLHMLGPIQGSSEKSIDVAIADLSSVLRPHLSIIDGTVGMEGLGPSAGQPKAADVVVVGTDAFAADAVACELMGTHASAIPHLRMGAERGYGVIDLDRISVTPDSWRTWVQPFCPPPANLTIEFPNIRVLDCNSCSACQSTVLLFLRHYSQQLFDYFSSDGPVHIAIGRGNTDLPPRTLCIGNCTAAHRDKAPFVAGCPPVTSTILAALTGRPCVDTADGQAQGSDPRCMP